MKKLLLCVGTFDAARFLALRPNFDVCWVVDDNHRRLDYLAGLFRFDPLVHFIHVETSSLDMQQFCTDQGIDQIDTLVLSFIGKDNGVPGSVYPLLRKKRVRVVECLLHGGHSGTLAAGRDLGTVVGELSRLLGARYERMDEGPRGTGAGCVKWLRKRNRSSSAGTEIVVRGAKQKQFLFNLVYFHLRDTDRHVARRGNVSVVVSAAPQEGSDLYLYLDAFGYRGKQKGFDLLFIAEPFVVLPGSYSKDIWDHFDHIFTLYDALIERDERFTKILVCRTNGWASSEQAITENMSQRERLYPVKGRQNAICMINGNKCSWVSGELYSKRTEAALWFWENSDVPFDVYGRPPFLLPNYKGGLEDGGRLPMLGRYRYNWCYENTNHPVFASGYVDKILDCLEARTIPIYLGNPFIEHYVPKECFIDFRDFGSYGAVNDYLHSITDDEYMGYIEHIDKWVSSGGLRPYSWFTVYDYLIHWYSKQTGIDFSSLVGEETSWERQPIGPQNGVTQQPLWSFDELRFRQSPFMDREDLPNTRPWESITADLNARFQRTLDLASQEKYSEALREIALCGFSFNAEHHLVCAQLMQLNGLQDAAFGQTSLALSLKPGHSYAHNQFGALLFQKNEIVRAEAEFRKAVELDGGNHLARKNLAVLLLHMGRKGEAMPLAKSVEPYFPEEVRAWNLSSELAPFP